MPAGLPAHMASQAVTGKIHARASSRSVEVRLLTLLIILVIAIPSSLIFAPLGGAGTPAEVLGYVLLVYWVFRRVAAGPRTRLPLGPVHLATLAFIAAILTSYVAATIRPIVAQEVSAADRGLLSTLAWLGMIFAAADGPQDRHALDTVMRRLCLGGGLLALLGITQFVTKMPLTNYIQIPGLSVNADLSAIIGRNGLSRPAGTAVHPIEFGAALTTILPIALHYAMVDRHRSMASRWFPVVAIAVAVPISISRSAILSAIVALAFLLPTWTRTQRHQAYGSIVVLFGVLYLFVRGLLGTLTSLFTGIGTDSSAKSRTDSYSVAVDFIKREPLFGRGFRTFLPSYRILDNQYLGLLIEVGIVGLVALLTLTFTSIFTSRAVRRGGSDASTRSLAQALAASVAASAVSFALYDAFSFPMAASTFFLVIGCSGALYRLSRAPAPSRLREAIQAR